MDLGRWEIAVGHSPSVPLPLCAYPPSLPPAPQICSTKSRLQIAAATRLEEKIGKREMEVGGTVMGEKVAGKKICQARSLLKCPSPLSSVFERRKNIPLNTRAVVQSFCLRISP